VLNKGRHTAKSITFKKIATNWGKICAAKMPFFSNLGWDVKNLKQFFFSEQSPSQMSIYLKCFELININGFNILLGLDKLKFVLISPFIKFKVWVSTALLLQVFHKCSAEMLLFCKDKLMLVSKWANIVIGPLCAMLVLIYGYLATIC
jgi:hypothetical protein